MLFIDRFLCMFVLLCLGIIIYHAKWVAHNHQKTFFVFFQASENYVLSSDTRSQLKFLEKLDQLEKQRKDLEEREMLLKAAKVRACVA